MQDIPNGLWSVCVLQERLILYTMEFMATVDR